MPELTVTGQQIQAAALTGLKILGDPDLKVPMEIALSGSLPTLQSLLRSVASGECILVNAPPPASEEKHELKAVEDEEKSG